MTYAFTQDVPIDAAAYDRIVTDLGPAQPPGLVVHLALVRPERGVRYVDVGATAVDWVRFAEERLQPVVHPMLSSRSLGVASPEAPS